jgi:hypothetical protein
MIAIVAFNNGKGIHYSAIRITWFQILTTSPKHYHFFVNSIQRGDTMIISHRIPYSQEKQGNK